MLHSGEAMLHASVELVNNNGVMGYVFNGVGIVLSSLQAVAGLSIAVASLSTGVVVGTAFGAMLMLHGINGIQEAAVNLIDGKNDAEGFLKKKYIVTAEFLGFDSKVGMIAYSSMDMLLSIYGIFRLIKKPDAWRLFHYINADYIRGINVMSRKELFIEVYNDGNSIKAIYDNYPE